MCSSDARPVFLIFTRRALRALVLRPQAEKAPKSHRLSHSVRLLFLTLLKYDLILEKSIWVLRIPRLGMSEGEWSL